MSGQGQGPVRRAYDLSQCVQGRSQGVPVYAQGIGGDAVIATRELLQCMSEREMRTVLQEVSQRLNETNRNVFVPRRLGETAPDPRVPSFIQLEEQMRLPPFGNSGGSEEKERDVFSRSDKWLTSPPRSGHEAWRTREDEILGMNAYIQELVTWANQ